MDLKADLYESKERNKDLEDRVCEAEEAAKEKAEELSDVIQRLRKDNYNFLAWSWFSVLQLIMIKVVISQSTIVINKINHK